MFKKSFCVLSPFLITAVVLAQNVVTDTSATVVAYWKKGETKNFTLKKITEQKGKNGLTKDSALFGIAVKVVNETDTSYTVDWQYNVLSMPLKTSAEVPGIESLCNNLHLVFTTDETGSFISLNNIEEIRGFLDKSFSLLLKPGAYSTEVTGLMDELKKTLSKRESIENLLMKDVQLYHSLYGGEYSITRQTVPTELPNVIGGDPFPAMFSLQLISVDKAGKSFTVETKLEIDKKATTKIVIDFLNTAGKKMGKTPITEADMPAISVTDMYRYVIDQPSGWITHASAVRVSDAMGSYKKETSVITIKQ